MKAYFGTFSTITRVEGDLCMASTVVQHEIRACYFRTINVSTTTASIPFNGT